MKYFILTFKLSGQVDLPRRQIETWKYSPPPPPPPTEATPTGTGTLQIRKVSSIRLPHSLARCRLEQSNFLVELKDCFVYARRHGTWNSLGRISNVGYFPMVYSEESDWPTATTRSKQF